MEGAHQSHLNINSYEGKRIVFEDGLVYKVFFFEDLAKDQGKVIWMSNDYAVLRKAQKANSQYVSQLIKVLIGASHVAFAMKRFEMSLRDYLEDHRDPRHLGKILQMVAEGV